MVTPTVLRLAGFLSLLLAVAVGAQTPSPASATASVTGVVFDSTRGAPLAGATVSLVGHPIDATTDARGHFRLERVPAGRQTLGFTAAYLDSLGVAPPVRTVEVAEGANLVVDLAVPSRASILDAACPERARSDSGGLILGYVRAAASQAPLSGARVVAEVPSWAYTRTGVARERARFEATTDRDGQYRFCDVPPGTTLSLEGRHSGGRSGSVPITMSTNGIVMRDLLVADSDAPRTARLAGRVATADGQPVTGARLTIDGDNVGAASGADGFFMLSKLPAGTQTLVVQRLGFAPTRLGVDLRPDATSHVSVTLLPTTAQLDTVAVMGAPPRTVLDAIGFTERRENTRGFFMEEKEIQKRGAIRIVEVVSAAPGMRVEWTQGGPQIRSVRASTIQGDCRVQWYLDGAPFELGSGHIDAELRIDEIAAIEVYSGASQVPAQFKGPRAMCGVIVLWTKRHMAERARQTGTSSQ